MSGFDAGGALTLLCIEGFSPGGDFASAVETGKKASLQKATLYQIMTKIVTLFTLCSSGKCGSIKHHMPIYTGWRRTKACRVNPRGLKKFLLTNC